MAISDRYILEPSPPITLEGREGETASLRLQQNVLLENGIVTGSVRRPDGTPVNAATVKLFNSNDVPFDHTNSNPAGNFSFPQVPVGSYFITASEPGLLTPTRIPISVTRNRPTNVAITMQIDPDGTKNAVFGIVRDTSTNTPLLDATIELYQVVGGTPSLAGIVTTNATGQYLFANLLDGEYFITASKAGYLSNQSAPLNVASREFAGLDIDLISDPDVNTGTISGFITDNATNQPIPNATVALYSISNGVETIVDITKSNSGGLYLFGDLPAGTYRVKATVQVEA
ncbi:MSCRAMM family protein [Risungbinella massiliensis]|uniref:MSCRAMM family protein n=1 Tax=Risungbinella massiliensis TaxID=1329796 RepID=UPI0005CC0B60|nr:carboxypeptidase-like regulatory domain-containing protein [Risungbinella massiliensis]